MEHNFQHIYLKYTLINCFLINADLRVLDISYSIKDKTILIQIVLLDGFSLSIQGVENIKARLSNYDITIEELHLTKEQFNTNKGEWQPRYYKWLDNVLFSKAEVL
jgi:hypothetical protein